MHLIVIVYTVDCNCCWAVNVDNSLLLAHLIRHGFGCIHVTHCELFQLHVNGIYSFTVTCKIHKVWNLSLKKYVTIKLLIRTTILYYLFYDMCYLLELSKYTNNTGSRWTISERGRIFWRNFVAKPQDHHEIPSCKQHLIVQK